MKDYLGEVRTRHVGEGSGYQAKSELWAVSELPPPWVAIAPTFLL